MLLWQEGIHLGIEPGTSPQYSHVYIVYEQGLWDHQ